MIINTMGRNMKCKTNNGIYFFEFSQDEMQKPEMETNMSGWTKMI